MLRLVSLPLYCISHSSFCIFSTKQCIIKQKLDEVFVISGNQGLGKCNQPRPITLASTLIIPDITKTSSNYCYNFRAEQRVSSNLIGPGVPYMTLYKPLQAVYITFTRPGY